MKSAVVKHVWLLLLPGQVHGWEVVRGISRFAKNRGWIMTIQNPREPPPASVLRRAPIDGVIGLIYHPAYTRLIHRRALPAVNMTRGAQPGRIPSVLVDDNLCGRMAADYFLGRGFQHFAYLDAQPPVRLRSARGASASSYAAERERGFHQRLAESGADVLYFTPDKWRLRSAGDDRTASRRAARRQLAWLHDLPKPIAVFTAYDPVALDLVHKCRLAGVRVPEDVAVLGVHNGQIACEMSDPPLSSIDTASEHRGYLAAQLLLRQFEGRVDPGETIVIPPVGIVSRTSTEVIAAADPLVAEALRYIRANLARGIGVAQVIDHLVVSRRRLERCFQQTLRRTPLQEIHRLRIARALDLLATTTMPVTDVAAEAGYGRVDRLAKAVRRATGVAPLAYRARFTDTR